MDEPVFRDEPSISRRPQGSEIVTSRALVRPTEIGGSEIVSSRELVRSTEGTREIALIGQPTDVELQLAFQAFKATEANRQLVSTQRALMQGIGDVSRLVIEQQKQLVLDESRLGQMELRGQMFENLAQRLNIQSDQLAKQLQKTENGAQVAALQLQARESELMDLGSFLSKAFQLGQVKDIQDLKRQVIDRLGRIQSSYEQTRTALDLQHKNVELLVELKEQNEEAMLKELEKRQVVSRSQQAEALSITRKLSEKEALIQRLQLEIQSAKSAAAAGQENIQKFGQAALEQNQLVQQLQSQLQQALLEKQAVQQQSQGQQETQHTALQNALTTLTNLQAEKESLQKSLQSARDTMQAFSASAIEVQTKASNALLDYERRLGTAQGDLRLAQEKITEQQATIAKQAAEIEGNQADVMNVDEAQDIVQSSIIIERAQLTFYQDALEKLKAWDTKPALEFLKIGAEKAMAVMRFSLVTILDNEYSALLRAGLTRILGLQETATGEDILSALWSKSLPQLGNILNPNNFFSNMDAINQWFMENESRRLRVLVRGVAIGGSIATAIGTAVASITALNQSLHKKKPNVEKILAGHQRKRGRESFEGYYYIPPPPPPYRSK